MEELYASKHTLKSCVNFSQGPLEPPGIKEELIGGGKPISGD